MTTPADGAGGNCGCSCPVRSPLHEEYRIGIYDLARHVSDEQLREVGRMLCHDVGGQCSWKLAAEQLGVDPAGITACNGNPKDMGNPGYEVLHAWAVMSEHSTIAVLYNVFKTLRRDDLCKLLDKARLGMLSAFHIHTHYLCFSLGQDHRLEL